MMLIADNSV